MKFVIVTLLVCIAGAFAELTEQQKEMLKPFKEACFTEVQTDQAAIDQARQMYVDEGKTDFNEKIKCFSACMFKKIGFMSEDGEFDEDMVRALGTEQFSEEVVDKAINACKNEVGKDHCDTAGKLFACFLKQNIPVSV